MAEITHNTYRAMREAIGLSQRAVERAINWKTGRLSVIERGLLPSDVERQQLLAFLGEGLRAITEPETAP